MDEKRLPTTTYRKRGEIGPAWVLLAGGVVCLGSLRKAKGQSKARHYPAGQQFCETNSGKS